MSDQSATHADIASEFLRSVEIMRTLRSENGCPWDIEQDHHSLKRHLIEEAYEVIHAIDSNDPVLLKEELGDVLLQTLFHAQIGSESGEFDISEVLRGINEKLIRRHPHIYGDVEVTGAEQVTANWESIKAQENVDKGHGSVLDAVPTSMPSLMLATKLQSKAARVGFDWPEVGGVLDKLDEEIAELRKAIDSSDAVHTAEEMGDVLFSLANLARHLHIDAEEACRDAGLKFIRRFQAMEEILVNENGYPEDLETWDNIWEQVKSAEKLSGTEDT